MHFLKNYCSTKYVRPSIRDSPTKSSCYYKKKEWYKKGDGSIFYLLTAGLNLEANLEAFTSAMVFQELDLERRIGDIHKLIKYCFPGNPFLLRRRKRRI